jgi:ABC-type antimicrobial peptide transport system permease subunit
VKPQTLTAIREAAAVVTGRRPRPDEIRTAESGIASQIRQPKFNTQVVLSFAVFGMLLAAMGIYGIVAQAVVTRTRELGIRVALGATSPSVMKLVSREAGALAGVGILVGIAASLGFARVLKSLLFMTSTNDPIMMAVAAAVLTLVAFCACLIPARKAAMADPMLAMRL